MLRSFLIGAVSGSRSLTPIAAVSEAARRHDLEPGNPAAAFLARPATAAVLMLLAAGELWGDKLHSAPDRIVPAGIAARLVTGGLSGAALAPRRKVLLGAALGATAAVGAAYLTFGVRMKAIRRFGQMSTGLVEDALTVGAARMVVAAQPKPARRRMFSRR